MYKKWLLYGFKIEFEHRDKSSLWGRFGGGWQWKVGIQFGSNTIILSCFVFEITVVLPPYLMQRGKS